MKKLLEDKRLAITDNTLYVSIQEGSVEILHLLLDKLKPNLTPSIMKALCQSANNDLLQVAFRYCNIPFLFQTIAGFGTVQMLELVLPKLQQKNLKDKALVESVTRSNYPIALKLLDDPDIDPSYRDNKIATLALTRGIIPLIEKITLHPKLQLEPSLIRELYHALGKRRKLK
jgi:hypothetical protein